MPRGAEATRRGWLKRPERSCVDCGQPSGHRQRCPDHWRENRNADAQRWFSRVGAARLRARRSTVWGRAESVAGQHNAIAARYGCVGHLTPADLRGLIGECVYCGGRQVGWDHVIPLSRGGPNTPDNLVPCCGRCNFSKRDRTPDEWLAAGLYARIGTPYSTLHYRTRPASRSVLQPDLAVDRLGAVDASRDEAAAPTEAPVNASEAHGLATGGGQSPLPATGLSRHP